jgi:hypothetical protein
MTRDADTDAIGAAVRAAARSVEAPPSLRASLARPPRRRWRRGAAAIAAALAAGVVLVAVTAGGPSVEDVAAAALHAPTSPAAGARSYGDWRPVGARTDTVDGRRARTVIYRRGTTGVHYAIVDGDPLDLPDARRVTVHGTVYALATDGDTRLVAWHARGKTCVLASKMEDLDGLLQFAAYGN